MNNDKETFKWHPLFNSSKSLNTSIKTTKLGEGSEHRQPIGINWRAWQWELTYEGPYAMINEIEKFLYRHGDVYSFNWTSPDGEEMVVKCTTFKKNRPQGVSSISATFVQVFE